MLSSLPLLLFTYEVFQGWYTNYKIHPVLSFRQSILLKIRKCRSSLEGLYNHQLCQNFGSYLIALEWHLIHLWNFQYLAYIVEYCFLNMYPVHIFTYLCLLSSCITGSFIFYEGLLFFFKFKTRLNNAAWRRRSNITRVIFSLTLFLSSS